MTPAELTALEAELRDIENDDDLGPGTQDVRNALRKAAGIADNVWARDLRASGITEGRASGATTDDAAKVAGHASTKTTAAVYDRATLEAAERFADARVKRRKAK